MISFTSYTFIFTNFRHVCHHWNSIQIAAITHYQLLFIFPHVLHTCRDCVGVFLLRLHHHPNTGWLDSWSLWRQDCLRCRSSGHHRSYSHHTAGRSNKRLAAGGCENFGRNRRGTGTSHWKNSKFWLIFMLCIIMQRTSKKPFYSLVSLDIKSKTGNHEGRLGNLAKLCCCQIIKNSGSFGQFLNGVCNQIRIVFLVKFFRTSNQSSVTTSPCLFGGSACFNI